MTITSRSALLPSRLPSTLRTCINQCSTNDGFAPTTLLGTWVRTCDQAGANPQQQMKAAATGHFTLDLFYLKRPTSFGIRRREG